MNGFASLFTNGHTNGNSSPGHSKKNSVTVSHNNATQTPLPLHIWQLILKYRISDATSWSAAAKLMLVCKAWQRLVWSLCTKLNFTAMPAGYLHVIVRNAAHYVSSFEMDKGDDLSVPFVLSSFSALTSLELLHCESLTDKGTRKLASLQGTDLSLPPAFPFPPLSFRFSSPSRL